MTTVYHTPIAIGAYANALTINTPLGALDAAIDLLDTRIDTIIASPGTSPTEVVDARGGFSVLADRTASAYLAGNTHLVDPTFAANNSTAHRFKTIALAMAAAAAGDTIMLAPGTYTETVTFSQPGVKLVGAGAAGYNVSGNTFGTGTIIAGRIDLANKAHCKVTDLTIDGRAAAGDGIGSGGSYALSSVMLHADIRNVVIVGAGSGSVAHGIRMEAGSGNNIDNVRIYACAHGIALRCSLTNVSNAYIYGCGSSAIIVKSATVNGDAFGNNISNCIFHTGAGLVVEGFDTGTVALDTNVVNCYAKGCTTSSFITRVTSGAVWNVSFTNCHSFDTAANGFDIVAGINITLTNCHSNSAVVGFKNTGATIASLIGCTSLSASGSHVSGTWVQLSVNGVTTLPATTMTGTLTGVGAIMDGTVTMRQTGSTRYYVDHIVQTGKSYQLAYDSTAAAYIQSVYQADSFVFSKPAVADFLVLNATGATIVGNLAVSGNHTGPFTITGVPTVNPATNSQNGMVINMPTGNAMDGLIVQYNGADSLRFIARAANRGFIASLYDNGASFGPYLQLGYNNNGSTPAAGHIVMYERDGSFDAIWPDNTGVLRIVNGSQPINTTDTGGTVVGAQTSWHAMKEGIKRALDTDRMLDAVLNLKLYDYQIKEDGYRNHDGSKPGYTGIVITEEDRRNDAWFASNLGEGQVPSLNERNLFGYMAGAIQALKAQIDELRGQVASLTASRPA